MRREHGVSAEAAATGDRKHSDAVTPVLQQLVYGNESDKPDSVKTALDAVKNDSSKLRELLCDTSTVTDYSARKITEDTLLKAALRAGDVEMCQMLIPYFDLIPDGKRELEIQFLEVFPDGVEAKYQELEEDSKRDFEPMLQSVKNAILAESDANLDATLNKEVNNPLYQILETQFRKPFEALSSREKIFNPVHYLRVLEVYIELCDQLEKDGSDPDYKKRDLFWRQIIGYIQRFMPANYAQAFVQGLCDLVKVDGCQSAGWRPKALERSLKFKYDADSYFSSSSAVDVRSGLGFDFAIYCFVCCATTNDSLRRPGKLGQRFFQKLLSGKNSKLSELYAAILRDGPSLQCEVGYRSANGVNLGSST